MKTKLLITALLSLISASSAFADIKVIKTQIEGQGYEINGVVNVASPFVGYGDKYYSLYANEATAAEACKSAGMTLHSFQAAKISERTMAVLIDGAIRQLDSSYMIQTLSCKANK